VSNITLLLKSQPKIYEDLTIPPTEVYIDGEFSTSEPEYIEGWYPGIDFIWEVFEDGNAQELIVTVFPASYNALIAQLRFYDHYEFQIDYVESSVEIVDAYMDSYTLAPGEDISIEVEIESAMEEEVWTVLEGTIRTSMGQAPVDGVELQQIDVLGETFVAIDWSVGQLKEGGYALDLVLQDEYGNPLSSRTLRFWIGVPEYNITSVQVNPWSVVPGGTIDVGISLQNAGDLPVDGRAWLWIYSSMGRRVHESVENLTTIMPNVVTSYSESIDLSGLGPGTYYVRYFAILDGNPLEPRHTSFDIPEGFLVIALLGVFAVWRRGRNDLE
jgi:hypothetical protein